MITNASATRSPKLVSNSLLPIVHDARRLLPHAGNMCLVDRVLNSSDGIGTVEGRVSANQCSVENGVVKTVWYVEMMAQGVAASFGYECMREGKPLPKAGLLIAIDKYTLCRDGLSVGDTFFVEIERQHLVPPFGIYKTVLKSKYAVYAMAEMKFLIQYDENLMTGEGPTT